MTSTCLGVKREHEASGDPRRAGQCVRCGRPFEPDAEPVLERDLVRERDVVAQAARFAPYVSDPEAVAEALSAFAERRAGRDPVRLPKGRDLVVEALEEVADLRNYVAWEVRRLELEERTDEDADREHMLLRRALAAAVESYDALSAYRSSRR